MKISILKVQSLKNKWKLVHLGKRSNVVVSLTLKWVGHNNLGG